MNPSLLPCLMGRVQGKPGVFNVYLMINVTFLNRHNQSKWFLLCLAAHLDGLPRGEGVIRRNLVLHCCLTFNLLQRLSQSSMQLWACAKAVPLLLPKAYGLEEATQAIIQLLGVRAWGVSVSGCGQTTA